MTVATMRLDIVSDAICPWCYIGKRHLEAASALLAPEGLAFEIRWNPYQLNPDMPPGGVARAEYRARKFGSLERSRELDAQVAAAGAAAGLNFRHDLMLRTPNTVDAHRLVRHAEAGGAQDATVETLFRRYFTEGADIGDHAVLADAAAEAGLDHAEALAMLAGDAHRAEVLAMDRAAREAGVNGVPSFFLEGYFLFSGAMGAAPMADALRRAHAILLAKAA
jgi:predicted DsbA family dithiol-disulfide isomerase